MNADFIIPVNGLPAGRTRLSRHAGREFFGSFGNAEILGADLSVEVMVEKSGASIGVDCALEGTLTVPCDRCLEEVTLPVRAQARLIARPGQGEPAAPEEGEREVVFYAPEDGLLDLSQTVYDYAVLALPLQRVHEEGSCNPEALRHLRRDAAAPDAPAGPPADSPFAALKDLLKN